jgi:hypothetical protein
MSIISHPSLCIPCVFDDINETLIRKIFNKINLGVINKVDIIEKKGKNGELHKRIFIHFKYWFNNIDANYARERLLLGKDIKIVYNFPWFWKVSAYRHSNISSNNYNRQKIHYKNKTPVINYGVTP